MKTTDSVMREEIIEFFSHHPTKQSSRNFLTRRLSHSLAEARREWVEEMVKLVTDKKGQCRNGGFCSVKCGHAGWWTNDVLDEILKSLDLLTGDNPERKV